MHGENGLTLTPEEVLASVTLITRQMVTDALSKTKSNEDALKLLPLVWDAENKMGWTPL